MQIFILLRNKPMNKILFKQKQSDDKKHFLTFDGNSHDCLVL